MPGNGSRQGRHVLDRLNDRFGLSLKIGDIRRIERLLSTAEGREQLRVRLHRNGHTKECEVILVDLAAVLGYSVEVVFVRVRENGFLVTAREDRPADTRGSTLPCRSNKVSRWRRTRRERVREVINLRRIREDNTIHQDED